MSLYSPICKGDNCCVVDDDVVVQARRLLYLSGFLFSVSITDTRANCKNTLPSVRTFLTLSSTFC
jgi:hypothetical protein